MGLNLESSDLLNQTEVPSTLPKAGDVVKFHQVQATPAGSCAVETPIFVRQELRVLFRKLNHFMRTTTLRRFYLSGPPGCGKTSFVTLWARMLAAHTSRRVLIINFREDEPCDVHVFHKESVIWEKSGVKSDNLGNVLDEYFKTTVRGQFHLCVFDGVRQLEQCKTAVRSINIQVRNLVLVKVVYVTSLAFRIKDLACIGENAGMMEESLDSWKLEGYVNCLEKLLEAALLPSLLQSDASEWSKRVETEEPQEDEEAEPETEMKVESESDDELPTQEDETDVPSPVTIGGITLDVLTRYAEYKYFYAGGCARFMFSFTIADLKKELDKLVDLVKDWTPFNTTKIPSADSTFVNSLMQQFTVNGVRSCVAVSKYILMVAYEKCDQSLIAAVAAIASATGNPSLQGWAFELQQLSCIKKVLKTPEDTSRHIKTTEGIQFTPEIDASYDGESLKVPETVEGVMVIWCLKWNQGCFDVALYHEGTLVTLQFTVSMKHSLKLAYVKELRAVLVDGGFTVNEVVHCFILKNGVQGFKNETPTGTGRNNCLVDFVVKVCKSSGFVVMDGTGLNSFVLPNSVDVEVHTNKRAQPGPGLSN